MRFHDLRHSHVAALIARGEHPKVIQTRLGHSSIKITLDRYGHLFDGLDEAAAERLNDSLMEHRAEQTSKQRRRAPPWNQRKPLVYKGFRVVELRGFEPLTP